MLFRNEKKLMFLEFNKNSVENADFAQFLTTKYQFCSPLSFSGNSKSLCLRLNQRPTGSVSNKSDKLASKISKKIISSKRKTFSTSFVKYLIFKKLQAKLLAMISSTPSEGNVFAASHVRRKPQNAPKNKKVLTFPCIFL